MKNYTITVNGKAYDVTVEEVTTKTTSAATIKTTPVMVANTPVVETPQPASTPVSAPVTGNGQAGAIKVEAGVAGKVFKVEVNVGQSVKKGDAIIIIEAMKMEIPVVAPEDGTVASISVSVGDAIEAGETIATLN